MSRGGAQAGRGAQASGGLLTAVFGGALLVITGIVLGGQYLDPNPRVIAVIAALLVFGVAWRMDMISVLGLLVILLPFPRATVFGNTNFALILLVMIIWMLRVSQRTTTGFQRSGMETPILAFLVVWLISFYNIDSPEHLTLAIANTELIVAGALFYFLIVSIVRTERDLRKLHVFQAISLITVVMFVLFEITHPNGKIIPGWIEIQSNAEDFGRHNLRVQGPFFDYELLAEFAALNVLLLAFLVMRAGSVAGRVVMSAILLMTTFVLFATVTRGAIVSLGTALMLIVWLMRRRLRVVPFTILVSVVLGGFLAMNFYVAHFTRSGDVIARLMGTEIKGFVPDDRTEAWRDGFDQWMMSPLLGLGPAYRAQIGARLFFWPHNGYLYIASMVGALGLGCFLWMMATMWRRTRPLTDSLSDPSYARSYLIVAQAQLVLFAVDQIKIDFLRNWIYQFEVWLMFASWMAAARIARAAPAPAGSKT